MGDDAKGPEGWESEDYEREKIRELREQGMDPGSAQIKLKSMGHPSARDLGTDERPGDVEVPVSGDAPGRPRFPGGDSDEMIDRNDATGGAGRPDKDAGSNG
jgi:hypothetical protein